MLRKEIVLICSLALMVLVSGFSSVVYINSVNAIKSSAEWGWLATDYPEGELFECEDITGSIAYACSFLDGNDPQFPYYWVNNNYFGDDTTANNVVGYLQCCNDYSYYPFVFVEFSTNWWIGDFQSTEFLPSPSPAPTPIHFGFAANGDSVWDQMVHYYATIDSTQSYSVESNQYFCFIWTCVNGGIQWDDDGHRNLVDALIGTSSYRSFSPKPTFTPDNSANEHYGFHYPSGDYVGMPFAFTGYREDDLSYPYCYIGFLDHSPYLSEQPPEWNTYVPTGNFPAYFYGYLSEEYFGTRHTIRQSLDYASLVYFQPGVYFASSPFVQGWWSWIDPNATPAYGWYFNKMMVYGDDSWCLPDGGY